MIKKQLKAVAYVSFWLGMLAGLCIVLTYKIVEWLLGYTWFAFIIGGLIIVAWEIPLLITMDKAINKVVNYREGKR